jgi:3-mercaptopyruvate sulfurtransferase SseA
LKDVAVYDGSLIDWTADPSNPMVNPAEEKL